MVHFWIDDQYYPVGISDIEKNLTYQHLKRQYNRDMYQIVEVILHHGGSDFPILTFETAAEAIDALVRKLGGSDDDDSNQA